MNFLLNISEKKLQAYDQHCDLVLIYDQGQIKSDHLSNKFGEISATILRQPVFGHSLTLLSSVKVTIHTEKI